MFRILLLGLFWACGKPDHGAPKGKEGRGKKKEAAAALLVDVSTVSIGSVANHHEFTGVLESKSEATIIPDVTGVVKAVHVREGDAVKIGDALADLVNPSVDAALQRATIELERAQREFRKTKQLQRQGAVSKRDFLEAKSAFDTAQTSFTEAEKSQKKLVVTSPLLGVVSTVSIRPGEQAGAAQAFTVVDPNQLRLVASIPERSIGDLKPGFEVVITAAYDAKRRSTGKIERLGPVVDSRTGSVKVFIDVDAGDNSCFLVNESGCSYWLFQNTGLRDGQPSVFVLGPPRRVMIRTDESLVNEVHPYCGGT